MEILFSLFLSFLAAVVMIPIFGKISYKYKLVKKVDKFMKINNKGYLSNDSDEIARPFLGGFVIFLSVVLSTPFEIITRASLIVLIFLGIVDEMIGVSKKLSFFVKLVVSFFLVYKYLGITLAFPLYAAIVFILIDSAKFFNRSDGICAIVSISTFLGLFFIVSSKYDKLLLTSSVGALLAFLIYNFPPARIHLGLTGEYFIGSLLSIGFLSSLRHWNSNRNYVLSSFVFLSFFLFESVFFISKSVFSKKSSGRNEQNNVSFCDKAAGLLKDERKTFFVFLGLELIAFMLGYLSKSNFYVGIASLVVLGAIYFYLQVTVKSQ